jgi:hypothetical protein
MTGVQPLKALTQAFPVVKTEPVVYWSQFPTMSMHRRDGKRISFRNGFFTAEQVADIQHLDYEIEAGFPGMRRATPEECGQAAFMENPIKATTDKAVAAVTAEFEGRMEAMRQELEAKFQERMRTANLLAGTNAGIGGKDAVGDKSLSKIEVDKAAPAVLNVPALGRPVLGAVSTAMLGAGAGESNTK